MKIEIEKIELQAHDVNTQAGTAQHAETTTDANQYLTCEFCGHVDSQGLNTVDFVNASFKLCIDCAGRVVYGRCDKNPAHCYDKVDGVSVLRCDLYVLAKNWAKEAMNYDMLTCLYDPQFLEGARYAWSRVREIGAVLGKEHVSQAIDEVRAELLKEDKLFSLFWEVYTNGDSEERKVFEKFARRQIEREVAESEAQAQAARNCGDQRNASKRRY